MDNTHRPTRPGPLDVAADLAAEQAAEQITQMVYEHGEAATDLLAGYWALAVAMIAAVAPVDSKDADDRLADAIDVALGFYPEEVTTMWFVVLEGSGLV